MDSIHARQWVTFRLAGRGVVAAFRKVEFSSRRAALVAKKEANYCW